MPAVDTSAAQIHKRSRYMDRVRWFCHENKEKPTPPWSYYPALGLWEQTLSIMHPAVSPDGRAHWIDTLQVWDRDVWDMPDPEFRRFVMGDPEVVGRWHAKGRAPMKDGGILDKDCFALLENGETVG